MLFLVSVSTKFQFPVSYDLKNAKLPNWFEKKALRMSIKRVIPAKP